MARSDEAPAAPASARRGNPLNFLLDLFSSVWLGITLLVLIFIYSSIGSAMPPVRQHRLLEMTEFEWFHWWPFDLLIALLSLNLVIVTLRRIPLRLVNAGVWMIHTGILILCAGSVYYFGTKLEGDTPVFRRRLEIRVPGTKMPATMLVRPDNQMTVAGLGGSYRFKINNVNPQWTIPDGASEGQRAYRAGLEIDTPLGRSVRHLVAGFPEYDAQTADAQGSIEIRVPDLAEPTVLEIHSGRETQVNTPAGDYHFQIANIQPDWPILTGDDAGKQAYSVSVMVTTPEQKFIRQLLAGYPQYTEDIIPGKGRAVKSTGRKLLDEQVQLALSMEDDGRLVGGALKAHPVKVAMEYEPQKYFYLQDSTALYVRPVTAAEWTHWPVPGMPHYHERISSLDDVWVDPGEDVELDPLNITVEPADGSDPFKDVQVRVTGYLRYAFERSRWREGGDGLNPMVGLRFDRTGEESKDYELAAFDPQSKTAAGGQLAFRWVESPQELQALTRSAKAVLRIEVPERNVSLEMPVDPPGADHSGGPFQKIEGTEYEVRIRNRVDNLSTSDGRTIAVLIVEIRTPQRTFTRMVADDPRSTRDMVADPTGDGHESFAEPDQGITMKFEPGSQAILTVIAGPDPKDFSVLLNSGRGESKLLTPEVGAPVQIAADVTLTVTQYEPRARRESRPWIVPRLQRDRDARKTFSMIQVTLTKDDWQKRLWLPYNHYALPNQQYRMSGRLAYSTRRVELPDGRQLELMYSRQRHPLPAPLALNDFTLLTHQGGLIGQNSNIRNYMSELTYADGSGQWSAPMPMSLNQPATLEGFWFFQSTWDPPARNYAGMNFTGVGVGNRNGVHIQLAGTVIAVLGMIFAFYIKPIIIRRRRQEVYAQAQDPAEAHRDEFSSPGDARKSAHTGDPDTLQPAAMIEEQTYDD